MTRFMRAHEIETYEELVARSVGDIVWFWDAVVRDLGISFLAPYEEVLDTSRGVEWATWFSGRKTNVAHQCVDVWADRTPEAVAVVWEAEDGDVRRVTYRELRELTDRLAHGLRSLGVGERDRWASSCRWRSRPWPRSWPAPSWARSGSRSSAGSVPKRSPRDCPTRSANESGPLWTPSLLPGAAELFRRRRSPTSVPANEVVEECTPTSLEQMRRRERAS